MLKKLVITGGHATPAIAVVEELRKRGNWDIYWIGEKQAVEGVNIKTLESTTLPQLGIPFYSINTPKFHRSNLTRSIIYAWKLPVGMIQAFYYLIKIRPHAILTFGSYISFPVAFIGWILKVPIVIHEQTAASGLANRIVSRIANKVAISFDSSRKYFSSHKSIFTGNPIRAVFFTIAQEKDKNTIDKNNMNLLILGGSRGSVAINSVILESIPTLLLKNNITHITGEIDFDRVKEERDKLPILLQKRYQIYPRLSLADMEKAYRESNIAISRSGANTVTELAAVGIPAIFIPLPMAGSDEQTKNAQVLVGEGSALMLEQSKLNRAKLIWSIQKIQSNLEKFLENAKSARRLVVSDAAGRIADLIEGLAC